MTTLRVYAAWLAEADQRASASLAARTHARPQPEDAEARIVRQPQSPREQLAVELRQKILDGEYRAGDRFPAIKTLAAEHDVAPSTVHRAFELLRGWGLIVSGQGTRAYVAARPHAEATELTSVPPAHFQSASITRLDVRRLGNSVAKLSACVDPNDADALQQLLVNVLRRREDSMESLGLYEVAILDANGADQLIFVASC